MINCSAVEVFSFSLLDVAEIDEFVDKRGEFERGSAKDNEVENVAAAGDGALGLSTDMELFCAETWECGSWCTTEFANVWSEPIIECSLNECECECECERCGREGLIAMGLATIGDCRADCWVCCWDDCVCAACPLACWALDGVRRAAAKISAEAVTRRSEDVYILTLFKQSLSYQTKPYYKPPAPRLYDT